MQTQEKPLRCLKLTRVSATDREASIVSTLQSSCVHGFCSHLLLDGKGLNGRLFLGAYWEGPGYCAATAHSPDNNWFSLELAVPKKVSRVQIIPRLDCCIARAQNIRITNGPSKLYDPNEKLCLPEIPQLVMKEGFTDYICDPPQDDGKFVKIFKGDDQLNLCEVKIFTLTDDTTTTKVEL